MKASIRVEQYTSRLEARKKRALIYAIVYGVFFVISGIVVLALVLPIGESPSNIVTFLATLLVLGPLLGLRGRTIELGRLKDILGLLDILGGQDSEDM
jgi:Na+/citrate or Na+/malate symporter